MTTLVRRVDLKGGDQARLWGDPPDPSKIQ